MKKNSITNKITPCCGLPFSVIYWWVSNLTLKSESDRQFILSKISQNGTISIDGWKVLINSGTLESDASLTKAEFLSWFDCGNQPKCEQLKIIIEAFKIGNWEYWEKSVEDLNEIISNINNNSILKINTIAELKLFEGVEGQSVILIGYYVQGDKSPVIYTFSKDMALRDSDDGGAYVKTDTGTWVANFNQTVSVKDFGAKGNNIFDDTLNIQKCFDYANNNELTAVINVGTFKITSTLSVGGSLAIYGFGQKSTLRPHGCDCLNILSSDNVLPREIKDFWIYGEGAGNNIGIKSTMTVGRATGISFNNIGFSWIGKMFDLQRIWHSSINYCYGMIKNGITLRGGCIKFDIFQNKIIRNESIPSVDETKGITINLGNGTRPEDVNIYNNLTFGFDYALDVETVLMINVLQNDFDYCKKEGIKIQQTDTVLNIKNNWIAQYVDNTTTQPFNGINLIPLGNANDSAKNIEGNTINGSTFGGYGVNIRANQKNANVKGNTINNHTGIYVEADSVKIEGNSINSNFRSIFYGICSNVFTDKNNFVSGFIEAINGLGNKNINFGFNNSGVISTGFKTKIKLIAGQTVSSGELATIETGVILDNPSKLYAFGKALTRSLFNYGKIIFAVSGDIYILTVENANTEDADFFCEAECRIF